MKRLVWSAEEDAKIRAAYARNAYGENALRKAVKAVPSRTSSAVLRRAVELGLTKVRDRYRWSQAEVDALEPIAHMSIERIQKLLAPFAPPGLKRTRGAIARQIHENRFRTNLEGLNHENLAQALGIARDTLHKYRMEGLIRSGGRLESLDLHRGRPVPSFQNQPWFYSNAEIRQFVCRHPNLLDLGPVAREWFIDLLRDGRYEELIARDREKLDRGKKRGRDFVYPVQGGYSRA